MITSLKNKDGYIYAIIEWEMTDEEHMLIKYAWVHDNHRNNGCIPSMIRLMAKYEEARKADFIGWERGARGEKFKWRPVREILKIFFKDKE